MTEFGGVRGCSNNFPASSSRTKNKAHRGNAYIRDTSCHRDTWKQRKTGDAESTANALYARIYIAETWPLGRGGVKTTNNDADDGAGASHSPILSSIMRLPKLK